MFGRKPTPSVIERLYKIRNEEAATYVRRLERKDQSSKPVKDPEEIDLDLPPTPDDSATTDYVAPAVLQFNSQFQVVRRPTKDPANPPAPETTIEDS